ncbi:FecR family protein [Flexithrix dorotheae]|uniref:FecR family protein n=1 Tax=Flexithrix dorotheae TaxID=70993 RepID=UPI00035C1F05|nr:FecR family protein [Flexithrix dorotheae]
MDNDRFGLLLSRKLVNKITPAELEELEQIIGNDKSKALKYKAIMDLQNSEKEQNSLDTDLWFYKTMAKISREEENINAAGKENLPADDKKVIGIQKENISGKTKANTFFLMKYAAMITLALGTAWLFYVFQEGDMLSHQKEILEEEAFITKSTEKGQKLTLTLPDKSIVKLNANSQVRFRKDFINKREIFLQGEAFFEVSKNPLKPFTVDAGGIRTTALGTSFNIRKFPNDNNVKIMLATGKVKVENLNDSTQKFFLNPSEQLTYFTKSEKAEKGNFKQEWISWKDGILFFENADIEEIKHQIEGWYGVKVKILGEVECSVSGSYTQKSLEHVLEGIKYTTNIDYEINRNEITFKTKQLKK